jgi:hypothetical protein
MIELSKDISLLNVCDWLEQGNVEVFFNLFEPFHLTNSSDSDSESDDSDPEDNQESFKLQTKMTKLRALKIWLEQKESKYSSAYGKNSSRYCVYWLFQKFTLFTPLLDIPTDYPWDLPKSRRMALLEEWKIQYRAEILSCVPGLLCELETLLVQKEKVRTLEQLAVIREAKVVGMTTSGCAKYRSLIHGLAPNIVICEEAGEVLESHVLAALGPNTEHLILIGDHQQLRPKLSEYFLSREAKRGYSLDVSMFERLVELFESQIGPAGLHTNGNLVTLQSQRRMRPIISSLIRTTLYPNLRDHECVLNYPPLLGMNQPLWFFDHNHLEASESQGLSSFTNPFEVDMVVSLTRYLIRQGYTKRDDIAILTPYLGQLLSLRKRLTTERMVVYLSERDEEEIAKTGDDLDGVSLGVLSEAKEVSTTIQQQIRLSTVDNFQGEEAKVIILSSVRCNKGGVIGFLKTKNRVNVMLSRAKHGMIILGSASTIQKAKSTSMLSQVIDILKKNKYFGSHLELKCQRHGNVLTPSTVEALAKCAVDGGCEELCNSRLPCGHVCKRRCHPDDLDHKFTSCREACVRSCDYGHPCNKLCSQPCECTMKVEVSLPCKHTKLVACKLRNTAKDIPCDELLPGLSNPYCSHKANSIPCSSFEKFRQTKDIAHIQLHLRCQVRCDITLECGHLCNRACYECKLHTTHPTATTLVPCNEPSQHPMWCGHLCSGKCGHTQEACPPCTKNCESKCGHSQCPSQCNNCCAMCAELCQWQCNSHSDNVLKCQTFCGNPCTRLPCDRPCSKQMRCGHPCPSICGELCPDPDYACKHCAKPDFRDRPVCVLNYDLTIASNDWDSETDPIIQLPCKHIITVDTLDGIFKMEELFYERNPRTAAWISLKPITAQQLNDAKLSPHCPFCKARIREVFRYYRALNMLAESYNKRRLIKQVSETCNQWRQTLEEFKSKKNLKSQTVTDKIRNCLRIEDNLEKLDPTRIIWERQSRMNPSELPYLARRYVQPYTMVLAEIVAVYEFCFTRFSDLEPKIKSEGVITTIRLLKLCQEDKLESSHAKARASLINLLQHCVQEDKDLFMNELKSLNDPELEAISSKLSKDELKMIWEAMKRDIGSGVGSFGGHWYECPNGHVYTIGECGGAMETSRCPECNAEIGGMNHQSASGNRPAASFLHEIGREDLVPPR